MIKLPKKIDQLQVNVSQQNIGVLTHGSHYSYQPTTTNLSPSLTMRAKDLSPYNHGDILPIFAQNLPEGFNRQYISEKLARYAKVNDMFLLALQGDEGIGLITYDAGIELPNAESLAIDDILKYSGKEQLFPKLLEKYYLRNMISGVQPKVSIPNLERTVHQSGAIVKASDSEFNLLTVNEYVCMNAANFCGLNTPMTYLSQNLETFIIERFDKVDNTKLGFEDFTTLMKKGRDPDEKYKSSYETLLKATYLFTHSHKEVDTMYKYIVFNCLIGNGDAHLKNFALTYNADMTNIKVSPIYDVTHTIIYDSIDDKMALKLNKSKTFPDKKTLIKLGDLCEPRIINPKEIIEEIAEGIMKYLNTSNEVTLLKGLRHSIEESVYIGTGNTYNPKGYFHDKIKKFE